MNQPIKFRAIDVATGSHLQFPTYFDIDNDGELYRTNFDEEREVVAVRYTGLKDKNGVEIYEGDIVSISYSNVPSESFVGRVEQIDSGEWFIVGRVALIQQIGLKQALDRQVDNPLHRSYRTVVEVIGNIYENQEMLTNETSPKTN